VNGDVHVDVHADVLRLVVYELEREHGYVKPRLTLTATGTVHERGTGWPVTFS
jgi:hypothetical protein